MADFVILHTMDDKRVVVNIDHIKYFKTDIFTYPKDPEDYSKGYVKRDNTTIYMIDGDVLHVKEETGVLIVYLRGDHNYNEK